MSITAADLGYNKVIINAGSNYAYKLMDYQWVTVGGVEVRYWIALPGSVKTGEFVPNGDAEAVTLFTEKYLTESFNTLWKKDNRFQHGDFLVSKDHSNVFLYTKQNGVEKVWRLDGAAATFQSTLANREAEYGTLEKLMRGWSNKAATFENLADVSK